MATAAPNTAQAWGLIRQRLATLAAGIQQAADNIANRIADEYSAELAGVVAASLAVQYELNLDAAQLSASVIAIGQPRLDALNKQYVSILRGIQPIHDAIYHRIAAEIAALGMAIS